MKTSESTDSRVLVLAPGDNVAIAKTEISEGATLLVMGNQVTLRTNVDVGHKFAPRNIAKGEKIMKYGAPIGSATQDIAAGEFMHTHNLTSDYLPTYTLEQGREYVKEATK